MTDEKLIHVKLEYEEAVQSKKDILSLEMDLLKTIQTIKTYHKFRTEELQLKIKLHQKIKALMTEIRHLQKNLPELKIPQILKEDGIEEIIPKEKHHDDNIESQLKKIQAKLDSLGTNNF